MMRKIKLTRANKSILLKALAPYYYQQRELGHSTEKPGRLILKINALPADKRASFSVEEIHLMRITINLSLIHISRRYLMCWMRRKDAPPELADRRAMLTCKITELRKEDRIAEGAIKRIQRTRESNRIDRENQEHHTNHNRRRNRSRQR